MVTEPLRILLLREQCPESDFSPIISAIRLAELDTNTDMSLIYALVARGNEAVLCNYTPYSGNFQQIAQDVLKRLNLSKMYAQFGTAKYNFYSYIKENYVFLVMVEVEYEMRIAISFLRDIADKFFERYPKQKRDAALPFSLTDFRKILEDRIALFNDKAKVDKFCLLQKELSEAEQISLKNLDKAIDRGEKIEILVEKTRTMADTSYDLNKTARAVKRKMWWKNKKVCIALIILIIGIGFAIAGFAGAFSPSKS